MKNFIILTINLLVLCSSSYAQKASRTNAPHAVMHLDSNTVYYDQFQRRITGKEFSDSVAAGHFTFNPEKVGEYVKSIKLVKVEGGVLLGSSAPDFTVNTIDGKTYKLSQLKGKTVVLNFWFTACIPCRAEMPELNKLVKKYHTNSNILFLAITNDNLKTVRSFLKTKTFDYKICAGQAGIIKNYGIASYPTNMIINDQGQVAFLLSAYGPKNIRMLDEAIESCAGIYKK